jgi:hypothetical protein
MAARKMMVNKRVTGAANTQKGGETRMGVAGSSGHPVLSSAAGEVVKCEWRTACKTKINSWNNNNSSTTRRKAQGTGCRLNVQFKSKPDLPVRASSVPTVWQQTVAVLTFLEIALAANHYSPNHRTPRPYPQSSFVNCSRLKQDSYKTRQLLTE